jgi:hypothetical protein
MVTFSGTGLVLLCILATVSLVRTRRYVLLACLLFGIATIGLWAPMIGMEKIASRLDEFSNSNASGFARFFSIFLILRDFLLPQASTFLFGMGAGSFKDIAGHVSYATHDPSWGKVVLEYGLIGALAYIPLMAHIFCSGHRSFYLRAALALQFLFLGEYILAPTVHGLIVALLVWPATSLWSKEFGNVAEDHSWPQTQSSC